MEPARGESFLSGQHRSPAALENDKVHPRIRNPYIRIQLQQPADENGHYPTRYRLARCGNSNPTRADFIKNLKIDVSCELNRSVALTALQDAW